MYITPAEYTQAVAAVIVALVHVSHTERANIIGERAAYMVNAGLRTRAIQVKQLVTREDA